MVTVGILAFLALCAGSFSNTWSWLAHYRLSSAAGDLVAGMQNARIEAIKRNCFCTITFNQPLDGTVYDYVIYVDTNRDLKFDAGETVLKRVLLSREYKGISLENVNFSKNDNSLASVAFNPRGFPRDRTGVGNGTIVLADSMGGRMSTILNTAGRVRTE